MSEPPLLLRRVRRPGSDDLLDVLIADGRLARIAPTGTDLTSASASRRLESTAQPIDADGAVLIPGLWDAHVHFHQWALRRERLDLSQAEDAGAVLDVVRSHSRQDAPLVGYGFRDATWPEPPSQAGLDAVAGERPVVLIAWDLHCAWLSTAAARWLGVHPDPDGVVREAEWFAASRRLDAATDSDDVGAAGRAATAAAARGVVGIVDLEMADNLAIWPERIARGVDTLRVRAGFYPDRLDAVIRAGLRSGDVLDRLGLLTVGPLKVIADGSLNTRTAYCRDPYEAPLPKEPQEHASTDGVHGHLEYDVAALTHLIARARSAGLGTAVHAIGDAAVTAALDAYAAARPTAGQVPGLPASIEHAQLVHPDDLDRFAELGVTASVQPEHAMDDRDIAEEYWPGRTGWAFPVRSLLDAGARVRFGSDAPVAPLDPWTAIAAAVTRSRDGRPPWHPEHRIAPAQALAASTATRGLLRPGDVADLALLDEDPVRCDPAVLRTMGVRGTLLGGRWTHSDW
ncbi:amidohydrolase [Ruania halotolerans]|uniref:amidohydrolase n=1 Tax=Ruania halotolerans TaxID=2897773 RepID=UPI001E648B39|nr:amidohydrolase family protein [Ruania halotolerans]UFU06923.1 amidohydrolase family protein [Ruania halotolerans]